MEIVQSQQHLSDRRFMAACGDRIERGHSSCWFCGSLNLKTRLKKFLVPLILLSYFWHTEYNSTCTSEESQGSVLHLNHSAPQPRQRLKLSVMLSLPLLEGRERDLPPAFLAGRSTNSSSTSRLSHLDLAA